MQSEGGDLASTICPMPDLCNHFAEIIQDIQSSKKPVLLTKNVIGTIVVMSVECYEEHRYESGVYNKLRETEIQALETAARLCHEEVMSAAHQWLHVLGENRRT